MRMLAITLFTTLSACYGNIKNHGDSSKLASDYVNQYYPNEFRLHTTYMGELFRKNSVFAHNQDPNLVLIFEQGQVERCTKSSSDCQDIVRAIYEQGKYIADVIGGVNTALSACQIPVLGVVDTEKPTLLVETPINDKAFAHLHQCLAPVYPLTDNSYFKHIHLELIAPTATPSPVRTVTIFDDPKNPRKNGVIYNAYFGRQSHTTLDNLKLALNAPFTENTTKAMIDEARRYVDKTKQGYMRGEDMFDPFTTNLVFNPANLDEYQLYVQACSHQPERDASSMLRYCGDSVVSLKYNAKTGKYYDHQWISTPNQKINMIFDLPKPF